MYLNAFFIGVKDSINPLAVSLFLIFFVAVNLWAFSLRRALVFCGFTFFGIALSQFMLFNGLWQEAIKSEIVWQSFKSICLVFSALLICVGILNFLDWYRLKKNVLNQDLLVKFAFPSEFKIEGYQKIAQFNADSRGFVWIFFIAVCCILLGEVIGVALFIWPQSYLVYLLAVDAISSGNQFQAMMISIFYSLAIGLPYLFIMAFRVPQVCFRPVVEFSLRYMSTIKIILSALFLAMGIVLGMFVFK